jgi:hypothetical protein
MVNLAIASWAEDIRVSSIAQLGTQRAALAAWFPRTNFNHLLLHVLGLRQARASASGAVESGCVGGSGGEAYHVSALNLGCLKVHDASISQRTSSAGEGGADGKKRIRTLELLPRNRGGAPGRLRFVARHCVVCRAKWAAQQLVKSFSW